MSTNDLKEKEKGIYDDNKPSWYTPSSSKEKDDLENLYKAPSATDQDLPDGHPSKKNPIDEEQNSSEGVNKKSKRGPLAKIGGKKGLAGILFGALFGGGFALIGLLSGPLQMLQFSQILQNTHFSPNEMLGRTRSGKLLRYAVTTDSPERRNMRFLGNRVADRYQTRLRQSGIELDFGGTRTLRAVRINPNTVNGQDYIRRLRANGVNVDVPPGANVVEVRLEGRGRASQARGVLNASVDTLNLNRASSAVGKRLLKVRGNVSFKPLRNTTRESGQNLRAYFSNRNQDVANSRRTGVDATPTRIQSETPDDPQARTANDVADTTRNDLNTGKQLMRNVNRGAGVVGLMCLAKGIYQARDAITYLNIVLPLMRIGVEFVAVGDQIRSGDDFSMDEVARVHDLMYDEEEENSVFSADAVRAAMGQEPVGNSMPEVAKPGQIGEQPALISAIDNVPGMDGACSRTGQLVMAVIGGPINMAFEAILTGLSAVNANPLDYAIDWVARALAGEEIDGVPRGALLGNYAMYGARLASNDSFISMGGRQLQEEEELEVAQAAQQMIREQQAQKPLAQRIFDVQDINSLAGKVILGSYGIRHQGTSNLQNLANLPVSLIKNIFGMIRFEEVAAANSVPYDYGFPRFGFSMGEIEDLDETFDPYENADWVEEGDRLNELNNDYGDCFNTTINPSNGRIVTDDEGALNYYEIDHDKCSNTEDERLLRYRLYLADMVTTKSLACLEMISMEACEDLGMDTTPQAASRLSTGQIIGDPNAPSAEIPCPIDTKDLGTGTPAYNKGQMIPTRLCEIVEWKNEGVSGEPGYVSGSEGGVIINSRVAGAWLALYRKAQSDGVNLRVISAFRTMEHQERLCRDNPLCRNGVYTEVAEPGYSNHQTGHAIDLMNVGGKKNGATCETRNKQTNSESWVWMEENARGFGFRVYSVEPWHWDADTGSSRC